jgi:hypothetical protein
MLDETRQVPVQNVKDKTNFEAVIHRGIIT